MTREELNTEIDNDITNVTTENGISPLIDGGNRKKIVDYIDERASVDKNIKISITSAQLLDLFETPIEVLPAFSNKLYVPRFVFVKYNYGTATYFYPSGNFRFAYNNTTNWVVNFSAGSITANSSAQSLFNVTPSGPAYSGSPETGGYFGKSLLLFLTNQNPITGDGTLDVYLNYTEFTI